ncbi:MAG: glycosyltransferase family 39 protein [Anaerolineaceae bacterium]|nr:glycosyltransferase family 39 protein [Anaerolineaceae bacterium]
MSKLKNRNWLYILISTLGAVLVWWGTSRGAGVGGDATIYMTSAKNFAEGIGLGIIGADGAFRLVPYFPPFYPIFLSVFSLFHLDLVMVARVVNTILIAATIYLVLRASDQVIKDWRYTAALGLLLAVSPVLNPAFSWVMSEPLSILLGTASLILCLQVIKKPKHNNLFYFSAILAGFSTLTRYGAIVYTATACMLLLIFLNGKFAQRLRQSMIYGLIALCPVMIWAVVDMLLTNSISSRSVHGLEGMGARIVSFFINLKSVLLFWLIPDSWILTPFYPQILNTILSIVFVTLIIIGSWFLFKKSKIDQHLKLFGTALMLFFILYVLMTFVISLVTYPPITIGTRMFSPMYLMAFWLIALILYQISVAVKGRQWLYRATLAVSIVLVFWSGWRGIRIVQDNHQTGLGFQSIAWQESDLIDYVNDLPEDQGLVTNEEMAVLFIAERNAYPFAEIYYDKPVDVFTMYGEGQDVNVSETQFRDHGAYLVLFDSIYSQFEGMYAEKSEQRLQILTNGLDLIYQGNDGCIYQYALSIEEK